MAGHTRCLLHVGESAAFALGAGSTFAIQCKPVGALSDRLGLRREPGGDVPATVHMNK